MSGPAIPARIQLSHRSDFDLGEASFALNGLSCVNVTGPSKWSNRYRVGGFDAEGEMCGRERAMELYRADLLAALASPGGYILLAVLKRDLRGKNLACWCTLDAPCHADVLLEVANS